MSDTYTAESLVRFATQVLQVNGMQADMAQDVAQVLTARSVAGSKRARLGSKSSAGIWNGNACYQEELPHSGTCRLP